MNKYRDFRRRRKKERERDREPNLALRQQNGSIKIRLVQPTAINIPIKVDRASSGRLENVSSLSLYSLPVHGLAGLRRVEREKNFPGYSFPSIVLSLSLFSLLLSLPLSAFSYFRRRSTFRNHLADVPRRDDDALCFEFSRCRNVFHVSYVPLGCNDGCFCISWRAIQREIFERIRSYERSMIFSSFSWDSPFWLHYVIKSWNYAWF